MKEGLFLKYYSNEIVFRGHPDKVCDQISDALLDAYLQGDKNSRCGIEVVGGKGKIFVTGEVSSKSKVNVDSVVNETLQEIGYTNSYEIINNIGVQSSDIAMGVDTGGAGDQGMMFGYACRNTEELLPVAMIILQKFAKWYDETTRLDKRFLPDGKAQITGIYDDDFRLVAIKDFTVSYMNTEVERNETDKIVKVCVNKICAEYGISVQQFHINPTGKFLIGGFDGDAGLTGRKIVVDNYQSFANVGGGAFSGKDPSKVDRSGAYKARQIAKKYVRENSNITWCEVQLSYAIGISKPLAIYIDTNNGNIEPPSSMYEECTPKNIIKDLKLLEVKYSDTAKFGHFGSKHFTWEN